MALEPSDIDDSETHATVSICLVPVNKAEDQSAVEILLSQLTPRAVASLFQVSIDLLLLK